MKKSKGSTSVDCLYMEFMLNKQMRSNIRMIHNRILNPMQSIPKPFSQIENRKIASRLNCQYQQQMIIEFQDNKILMSKLYQPMVIHSHRVIQNNKNCTIESPKFKRSCIHMNNGQISLKHQHYLKKGGQNIQTTQQQAQETKPWHPYIRTKRKKHIQNLLEQKQSLDSQPIQGITCFQGIGDLSGWQTQEDPQIEIQ
ncbi:unnamed protein product [Paramecium sonneborni]|uniref:Uncharacterized protein n=1 Tax=Paramecium sonneborni TaxID=65129 RepID=A0A8S1QK91_9CILI|nr:unnamed protein product [Paramecium sonneborni]